MKTAIVILNWNGRKMLAEYLPTVIEYSRDEAEIIVADNASTDGSVSWLKETFPQVRQIILDRNYGFAEGYNRALKQVDAEYYVLLNSDVRVTHHWLTPLIEVMDTHTDIAACQPKLLSMRDTDAFEYAGASGGYIAIRSVVAGYSTPWKMTTDSMTTPRKSCGLQAHALSFAQRIIGKPVGSTAGSSPTMKR